MTAIRFVPRSSAGTACRRTPRSLALGLMAAIAVLVPAAVRPASAAAPPAQTVIEIIEVAHADVGEVFHVVSSLFVSPSRSGSVQTGGETWISLDNRRNALVVRGLKPVVDEIKTVVAALDLPVPESDTIVASTPASESYELRFHDVRAIVGRDPGFMLDTIRPLLGPEVSQQAGRGRQQQNPARISISNNGMLAVYTTPAVHTEVTETLRVLRSLMAGPATDDSGPAATDANEPLLLRISLLSSGTPAVGRPIPADLADVVTELEGIGLENWRTLGRLSLLAGREEAFQIATTLVADLPWNVVVEGSLISESGNRIRLDVNLEIAPDRGDMRPTRIETAVVLEPGRQVVLGLSPMLDRHTAFVIELVER